MDETKTSIENSGEKRRSQWTMMQTLKLIGFIIVSLGLAALLSLAEKPPGERTGTMVFFAVFGVFIFIMVRFEKTASLYTRFFISYFRFTGGLLAMTLPLVGFSWLSRKMLASFPLWLQILCLTLWGILLGGALILIATKKRRNSVLGPLQRFSMALPAVYSFQILMLACLFFSTVSFIMVQHGLLTLTDVSGKGVTPGSISDFFLWHFLDAVPLVKVNETLNFKVPLTYETFSVGLILLVFKAVVIIPVIGAFTWYGTREDSEKSKTPDAGVALLEN